MVGDTYESHDACPNCGSRVISRKKDTPAGRPRDYPEPYTCKRCNTHFEDPEEIRVLITND